MVAVHLAVAWTVGGVVLPALWVLVLITAYVGGKGGSGLLLLGAVAVVLGYLFVAVSVTRDGTVLGATVIGRLVWTVLVLVAGTVGWAAGWAVTDRAGLGISHRPLWTMLLGGVPFVLVAALLVRGWQVRVTSAVLCLALIGTGVVLLRQEPPGELDARLAAAGVHRESLYVVAIPGYRPTGSHGYGDGGFYPTDPAAVPPDRYITIVAYDRLAVGADACGQPTALDSRLMAADCTVEPDGLVYRHSELDNGYQVTVGQDYVTVVGTPAVGHDLLRDAALSLRPATTADLGARPPTDAELRRAFPPSPPRDGVDRFRRWLRG